MIYLLAAFHGLCVSSVASASDASGLERGDSAVCQSVAPLADTTERLGPLIVRAAHGRLLSFVAGAPGPQDLVAAKMAGAAVIVTLDRSGAAQARQEEIEILRPQPQVDEDDRSALYSPGTPPVASFRLSQSTRDTENIVGLVHTDNDGASTMLALVVPNARAAGGPVVDLYWQAQPLGSSDSARLLDLAGLENLYNQVRRLPALQWFALHPSFSERQQRLANAALQSKSEVLAKIAKLRNCVVEQLDRSQVNLRVRGWRSVSVIDARGRPSPSADSAVVAVRVTGNGRSLEGTTVGFERGSDLVCIARVDARGMARCKLFDPHPHAGHDDEDDEHITVATFSGEVGPNEIQLPTAVVLRDKTVPGHSPRAGRHSK